MACGSAAFLCGASGQRSVRDRHGKGYAVCRDSLAVCAVCIPVQHGKRELPWNRGHGASGLYAAQQRDPGLCRDGGRAGDRRLFAEKAEKCNRQIEVLTSGNLRQRVAAYLLENCDPDYRVRLHMNREDLAVYLNTTRPSLSRMLLTLQDEGIIRLVDRKVIEITDYERLQSEE